MDRYQIALGKKPEKKPKLEKTWGTTDNVFVDDSYIEYLKKRPNRRNEIYGKPVLESAVEAFRNFGRAMGNLGYSYRKYNE